MNVAGDSLVGMMAARASGALPVWVENTHAPDARAYASHVIRALPDLPPLLARIAADRALASGLL